MRTGRWSHDNAEVQTDGETFHCTAATDLSMSASSRLCMRLLKRAGTRLLVTEMTPAAPLLWRAACASSSLPLQHAMPCPVYACSHR